MAKDSPKLSIFNRLIKSPWPIVWAVIALLIFFALGDIIKMILPYTKYAIKPGFVAEIAADYLRKKLAYPIPAFLHFKGFAVFLIIPYYLILSYILFFIHLHIKRFYKYVLATGLILLVFLRLFPGTLLVFETDEPSASIGKPNSGSVMNAKRIPYKGFNYITYSFIGYLSGRTFVNDRVKSTVLESFEIIDEEKSERRFVIGETGGKEGGPFALHKGKENGMEVDFLLPLNEPDGAAYTSQSVINLWNYDLEAKKDGSFGDGLTVDYADLALHIATLYQVAPKYGLVVRRVEMNPVVYNGLYGVKVGKLIQGLMKLAGKKETKKASAYYTVTFEDVKDANRLRKIIGK